MTLRPVDAGKRVCCTDTWPGLACPLGRLEALLRWLVGGNRGPWRGLRRRGEQDRRRRSGTGRKGSPWWRLPRGRGACFVRRVPADTLCADRSRSNPPTGEVVLLSLLWSASIGMLHVARRPLAAAVPRSRDTCSLGQVAREGRRRGLGVSMNSMVKRRTRPGRPSRDQPKCRVVAGPRRSADAAEPRRRNVPDARSRWRGRRSLASSVDSPTS